MPTFDDVMRGRPAPTAAPGPVTAEVTQSDASGVWCTPLGGDSRNPIGPCWGGWRRSVATCSDAAHDHPLERLPVRTVVLLQRTSSGPWITRVHEGPAPR